MGSLPTILIGSLSGSYTVDWESCVVLMLPWVPLSVLAIYGCWSFSPVEQRENQLAYWRLTRSLKWYPNQISFLCWLEVTRATSKTALRIGHESGRARSILLVRCKRARRHVCLALTLSQIHCVAAVSLVARNRYRYRCSYTDLKKNSECSFTSCRTQSIWRYWNNVTVSFPRRTH